MAHPCKHVDRFEISQVSLNDSVAAVQQIERPMELPPRLGFAATCPFSGLSPRAASGGARLPSLARWVNYTKNLSLIGQGLSAGLLHRHFSPSNICNNENLGQTCFLTSSLAYAGAPSAALCAAARVPQRGGSRPQETRLGPAMSRQPRLLYGAPLL